MTQRELVKCPHCESTSIFIHQEDDLCLCGECGEAWEQATKAQAVPQWIPVSERLPTYGDNVLIVADGEIETENQVFEFKKGKFSSSDFFESNKDDGIYYYIREITHWMPLPAPPTNQEVE